MINNKTGRIGLVLMFATGIAQAATYYVDAERPDDSGAGTSWPSAKHSIQAAVDLTTNDDTVLVTNGVYDSGGRIVDVIHNRVVLTNSITLQSINGPDVTSIVGAGPLGINAVRCLYVTNQAHIAGFTIKNGCSDSNFSGTDSYGGGAMLLDGSTVSNCVFSDNAALVGGAMLGGKARNCTFVNNNGGLGGGAVYQTEVRNSLFTGNTADIGGAMVAGSAYNCTIVANHSPNIAGGVVQADLYNCIVWGNTAGSPPENLYMVTNANYSCSPDLQHSLDGNITNAPQMISSSHIAAGSPCRSAGNLLYSSGTDIDGDLWISAPSIGCDQYNEAATYSGPLQLQLTIDSTLAMIGDEVTAYAQVLGKSSGFSIDFGDDAVISNQLSVAHAWNQKGDYDVILKAVNDDYPAGQTVTQQVQVASPEDFTLYVSLTGNDLNDGGSWSTAKATLQGAIAAQQITDSLIIVSNGTYTLSAEIEPSQAVIIRSVNGPDQTIIDGDDTVRCFNLGSYACTLDGFTIRNGHTQLDGGGILLSGSGSSILNCILENNYAGDDGAGIYCSSTEATVSNCVFRNNHALDWGGGLYCSSTYPVVIDSRFEENQADDDAGGSYRGTIKNSWYINNTAADNGGGMYNSIAIGCAFIGNSANDGGGTYYGTAKNCTITFNSAAAYGGGTYDTPLYNSIIRHNTAATGGNNLHFFDGQTYNSCAPELTHGSSGNITNAPHLVSASHIATNSPCRGTGDAVYATGKDIDGELWQNPPAMGCDENNGNPLLSGPLSIDLLVSSARVPVGSVIEVQGIVAGSVSGLTIDFDDGTLLSNTLFSTHTWGQTGSYDVVLSAFNNIYPAGVAETQRVEVLLLKDLTQFVSTTGNDANDGSSWAHAKATIQAGIDAQQFEGASVWVSNGTYSISSEITVNKALKIISLNGPASTSVDAGGLSRCFNLGNTATTLSGFTIANGSTGLDGGGVLCSDLQPVITNCIFAGNEALGDGGGLYMGTTIDCIFSDNLADDGGGMSDGIATSCIFSNNTASYEAGGMNDGTAVSCQFINNSAVAYGGGTDESSAENCIFSGNFCEEEGGGAWGGTNINCTFTGNVAVISGGGVFSSILENCIVWSNHADVGANDVDFASYAVNTCSPDLEHNVDGNISNAPLFEDVANGNLRLTVASPCVDAGSDIFATTSVDFDGNPRIQGNRIDMGAFERAPSPWLRTSIEQLSYELAVGNALADNTFNVWGVGISNLTYALLESATWFSLSPIDGSSAGEYDTITVDFDTVTLPVGSYQSDITVTGNTPNTVVIPIFLNVYEPQLDHFEWAPLPSAQLVGQPFDATIRALDNNSFPVSGFTGAVAISSSVSAETEIGNGTENWDIPVNTYYHDCRTQIIYLQNEIGAAAALNALALNITEQPELTLNNFTIRLRHTSLSVYSLTPTWESDWTVVYQADETISSIGWTTFRFDTLFAYNGTNNLMVDISFNNTDWTNSGECESTDTLDDRSIYYQSDSDDGDPLTWTGTTTPDPDIETMVPNIKLIKVVSPISVSPTTSGAFSNGTWSGEVTVNDATDTVRLIVENGSHTNYSTSFGVFTSGSDRDGDIISDYWEQLHYNTPTGCNPSGNSDGDRLSNLEEFIAGSIPTNADSIFVITNTTAESAGINLQWSALTGRVYTVWWTPSLTNNFQIMDSMTEYPVNGYTATNLQTYSAGFYKVGVELQ